MALATYADLQTAIPDFLNRVGDSIITAAAPTFIALAEAQMTRRLLKDGPVRQMLGTWSTTISAELTTLPTDFQGVKSLYLASVQTSDAIEFVEPEKIAELKILYPNQGGDPQKYSIVGTQIQFWPFNTGSYAATILYWQAIPALSISNTTNWLLTAHPDAYLYTSLIQSAPYLKADERLQTWATLSQAILSDIVEADKTARFAPHISAPFIMPGAA